MTLLHLVPGEPLRAEQYNGCEITIYADRLHDVPYTGTKIGYKITEVATGKIVEAANGLRDRPDLMDLLHWTIDAYNEEPWES